MHPAPSIILFTTLSGAGFGLLFWLGIDTTPPTGWAAFAFFTLAYLLAVGGLMASVFHLGQPKRALKAFREWRSSWLSREAWTSAGTLTLMALYGAGLTFAATRIGVLGLLGAVLALLTVFTTSMIYAQLRTVPRWHTPLTPLKFLTISLAGGALLSGRTTIAIPLLLLAGALQLAHWLLGDRLTEPGSALVPNSGTLRAFEPPHIGDNYLTHEMAFTVARRHALKLRVIALLLMAPVPALLLALPGAHLTGGLAVLSHVAGVLAARWLFFAEAQHVQARFYGTHARTESV